MQILIACNVLLVKYDAFRIVLIDDIVYGDKTVKSRLYFYALEIFIGDKKYTF